MLSVRSLYMTMLRIRTSKASDMTFYVVAIDFHEIPAKYIGKCISTEGVNRGVAAPMNDNKRHSDRKRYGTQRVPRFRGLNVVRGLVIIM